MSGAATRNMAASAVALLKGGANEGWTELRAAFGNEPIPSHYVEEVRVCLCSTEFAVLVTDGSDTASKILAIASTFLEFVANDKTIARFSEHLPKVATALQQAHQQASTNSGPLLDAALNVARCAPTSAARVAAFADMASELVSAWPSLGEAVRPSIDRMCDDLPLSQTAEMWRLRLRSQ